MLKKIKTVYLLKYGALITILFVLFGRISFEKQLESPTITNELFTVSTFHSLNAGNYDGILTLREIKQHGSNGIGTFHGIDGEMIYYRDTMYRVLDTGDVVIPNDSLTSPFAAVFHLNRSTSTNMSSLENLQSIIASLNEILDPNDFYAIVFEGDFDTLKLRSISAQEKPYPLLPKVIEGQSIFEYYNISGAMVGMYAPAFVGEVTVPGYHFHFISADGTRGGHVLDISINSAEVYINRINSIRTVLSK
jgi:acetolactate decarboxylase